MSQTPAPPTRPAPTRSLGADDATVVPDAAGPDETFVTDAPAANARDETFVTGPAPTDGPRAPAAETAAVARTQPVKAPGGKQRIRKIGDFALVKKLGAGGMGDVYLAKQVSLDRKVALKTLKPELAKREDFVARFMREARSMGRLDHPNVVRIYGAENTTVGGRPFAYAAIEYVNGKSMQDWMDELKVLPIGDAVAVTLVVADALRHAHEQNMIHRDIKPDNILLTRRGVVKVADFGLAKAIDEDQSLTQSGVGMGTPLYMAPEQARNAKHVGARSDVYALGATLYYFLTGDLPFRGESTIELLQAKEAGRFDSARKRNTAVPHRLDDVLDRMMARDPEARYGSCAEVIRDLSNLNLATPALSFVDEAVATAVPGGSPAAPAKKRRASRSKPVTSREEAEKQRRAKAAGMRWHVQNPGRPPQRMTTEQVQKGIAAGVFGLQTKVKKKADGTWAALAQFPEFESAANALVQQKAADKRRAATGDQFAKLARQQDRRKFWVKLGRTFDGVKGLAGLLIWLAVIGGVGWAAWTYGWPLIQEQIGGGAPVPPAAG